MIQTLPIPGSPPKANYQNRLYSFADPPLCAATATLRASRFALRALRSPSRLRAPGAAILLLLLPLLLSGCGAIWRANAAPVFKVGVIAPFEGRARALGYAILPAVKDAVAEANRSGILGAYRVTVVAFNDSMDPATAAQQAKALALDPDVIGVVGPFTRETEAAASPILSARFFSWYPVVLADPLSSSYGEAQRRARAAAASIMSTLARDLRTYGRPVPRGPASP